MRKNLTPALLIVIVCLLFGQAGCRKKSGGTDANADASANPSATGDKSQAQVLVDQGRQLYRDDEDEKALEAFKQAIKLDPELPEAYFRLGLAHDALAQAEEAEDAYKKAVEKYKKYLEHHSDDAEAHYNLGQTYAGLSLHSEAVREYRQATRLKEDDADVFYDLGTSLMKLAQYDEAVSAFSKSLEIDPNNYRAEDSLEEAREGVKRIRAGRKHQEDLLKKKKEEDLKKLEEGNPNSNTASSSNSNSNKKP